MKKDKFIREFNAKEGKSYKVGHNKFSTWTDDEYKSILGFMKPENAQFKEGPALDFDPDVATVDWRDKGAVNEI